MFYSINLIPIALIALALVFTSCATQSSSVQDTTGSTPRFVFLFIGDGMGFSQIAATEAYLADTTGAGIGNVSLSFTEFPAMGMATTHSANSFITCSSAAGTALSTGFKTNNDMLCVDPRGERLTSITYHLKDAGFRIGIATSVSIDHATPAAFYGSDSDRRNYYGVAQQLASSGFDFFAGSGFLDPRGISGTEEDIHDIIRRAGYAVVRNHEQLSATSTHQKVVIIQEESRNPEALVEAINRTGDDGWTLSDFTRTGIDRLYNPNGFFFMVEGGQIDWHGHANDAAAVVYEMIDFSHAIEIALEFYRRYPNETLIVITADHETGGLALGYYDIPYLLFPSLLAGQRGSSYRGTLQTGEEQMAGLNRQAGFGWTSGAHTGGAVPVFAIGAGSELFRGKMDNTDIPMRIRSLMQPGL